MVGDRSHDAVGAAAHGLPCLGVAWGYAEPGELEDAGAIGVVPHVDGLAAAVLDALAGLSGPASPAAGPTTGT
jgi:phosphoglycolate phosphatase